MTVRPRARVERTAAGWVAHLCGGSVSRPMTSWRDAFDYADAMTRLFRAYWGRS